ncbi:hypothetical protein MMC07_003024 [Pseudocyphellaria aurata]|nr:hypothetical protein [Pseudocyphellaria aurata]
MVPKTWTVAAYVYDTATKCDRHVDEKTKLKYENQLLEWTMDSSKSAIIEASPTMEIADPNGDVILLAGTENPGSIKVSSKILALASPVFAAMLGPSFLEGSNLSATEPYQLRLPEDDAEAMIWFCLVLHYRRDIDECISLSLFEKMALLCNKYDCAKALSPWSKVWLHRVHALLKVQADYERLLYCSYVYGVHDSFWQSSKAFLEYGLPSNLGAPDGSDSLTFGLALLPDDLLDSLNHDREEMILSLHQTVENLIQPYLNVDTPVICKSLKDVHPIIKGGAAFVHPEPKSQFGFVHPYPGPNVCLRPKRVLNYFRELLRVGLWPITGSMRETTVKSTLAKFRQYENKQADIEMLGGFAACDCIRTDFSRELQSAATAMEKTFKGLCLRCVQNGKFSVRDGNCQARRREHCSTSAQLTTFGTSRRIGTLGTKSKFEDPSTSTAPDMSPVSSPATTPSVSRTPSMNENRNAFVIPNRFFSESSHPFGAPDASGASSAFGALAFSPISGASTIPTSSAPSNALEAFDMTPIPNPSASTIPSASTHSLFEGRSASTAPSASTVPGSSSAYGLFGSSNASAAPSAHTTNPSSSRPHGIFGIPGSSSTAPSSTSAPPPSTSGSQSLFGSKGVFGKMGRK